MAWVDPNTGEEFASWQEGLIEVDLEDPTDQRGQSLDWLGDWFTKKLVQIKAERDAIKVQHAIRMKELEARERALWFRWGPTLKMVVGELLDGAKKKSVDFAYGRVGWRKSRRIEVRDEEAALRWARQHAPHAIKRTESILKTGLPAGEDVPGVEWPSGDEFYARGQA